MIGIIDYGMGNLRSVSKALERLGASVYVGDRLDMLKKADKLILPGVGAFGAAMHELKKRGLIPVIKESIETGKPFLGICLGLQLLFEKSQESPKIKGLSIWKGSVIKFSGKKLKKLKIPHMGWNEAEFIKKTKLNEGLKKNEYFYFVHSFYGAPADKTLTIAKTEYGTSFPAVLGKDNVYAVQFHPEKSQKAGLQILKNFIKL